MRRNRKGFWDSRIRCTAAAVALGAACTALCAAAFAGAAFLLAGNADASARYAMMSLGAGSFSGGWVLGKITRRNGLAGGAVCGTMIYLILLVISLICGGFAGTGKLLLAGALGAAGGVCGVNSKRPSGLMR